jgi:hypothetical protein
MTRERWGTVLLDDFEVDDLLACTECYHSLTFDSLLTSNSELCIVEFFSRVEDVYFLDFYTVEHLEGIFDIDLGRLHIDVACVDTAYFTVGRLVGDDESFDD